MTEYKCPYCEQILKSDYTEDYDASIDMFNVHIQFKCSTCQASSPVIYWRVSRREHEQGGLDLVKRLEDICIHDWYQRMFRWVRDHGHVYFKNF